MAGNDGRAIVVQERDRRLLEELATLRVADREQVKASAGFHSTSRVNVRLLQLVHAGLLKRFFLGSRGAGKKALYALAPRGAQLVHVPMRGPRRRSDQALVADFFVEHQLEINRLYCSLKFNAIPVPGVLFHRWVCFTEPLTPGLRLIPDGYFELGTPTGFLSVFLEVDLGHESLKVWKEKVRQYLHLAMSGDYERTFDQPRFRVLVVANSERRMHSIRKAVAPVTEKLFWFASLERIAKESFFGPIWFRPRENQPQGFIKTP